MWGKAAGAGNPLDRAGAAGPCSQAMKPLLVAALWLLALLRAQALEIVHERVLGPEIPHKYKHPACIAELRNGDLLIAYHGGTGEYEEDTAVWATRLQAGTQKWSPPAKIADTPFHGDGNPVVWQGPDDLVWLFYVVRYGKTWSDSRIQSKVSRDQGASWSDSFVLAFEPGMMVRNQPIVLTGGDYLLPVYHEKGGDPEFVGKESTSLFLRYESKKKEWTTTGRIVSRLGNIQPGVVELSPGRLVAYCRRGGGYDGQPDGFIVRAESKDAGQTWSPGTDSEFPNPNAAVEFLKLRSGNLLLVYNNSTNSRTPLTAALSTDGGKTFPHRRNIREGEGDFGYPYAIQTKSGEIQLVYTSEERSVVNRAVFDERWLLEAPAKKKADGAGDRAIRHVDIYRQPGRFGGWPANHGMWAWGDEILVGFSAGFHKDLGEERHNIDRERPEEHLLARSLDGGETWAIENPSAKGALVPAGKALHGVAPPGLRESPWRDCPGGVDFTAPGFALTARMTSTAEGASRFYCSTNRGHDWQGPFGLPLFGLRGIAARTEYLVEGKEALTLFLTGAKEDGTEGRPLCVRTADGARSWQFLSFIGPEPKGYAIMPSVARWHGTEWTAAIRCREGDKGWIETYRSADHGASWKFEGIPAPDLGEGNPPSLIALRDGSLCLTYGSRRAPQGIKARLSRDGGKSWGEEIELRGNAGGRDIGYPRSAQRQDGKVVTVYYFHDQPKTERDIAATIWDPAIRGGERQEAR